MIPRVTVNTRPAREYLRELTQRELPRVIGRSLDRIGARARTRLSRDFRARIALPKAVVDRAIKVRRSRTQISSIAQLNAGGAWFELVVSGQPFPLRDFGARQTSRRGVTFKVARAGARRTYARLGRSGFILEQFGGHVFVRKEPDPPGPQRAGIKKVFGPSLPQFFATKRMQRAASKDAAQDWVQEVTFNARFALQRRR